MTISFVNKQMLAPWKISFTRKNKIDQSRSSGRGNSKEPLFLLLNQEEVKNRLLRPSFFPFFSVKLFWVFSIRDFFDICLYNFRLFVL